MPYCTILVPTHRDTLLARATLSYLAHFACDSNRVIIADNSTNPEKHDFLRHLVREHPQVQLHLHSDNIGGMKNLGYLLEHSADSDFVALCSDDDHLSLEFVTSSLEIIDKNPKASGVAGHLLALHSNGSCSSENFSLTSGESFSRLSTWFDPNTFNLVLYSVFRRSALQPWVDFCHKHPMRAAFFDFLITISAFSRGQLLRHAKGAYLWSAGNWDTPEINFNSRTRWYKDIGMPEQFTMYFDLHFAVECAAFLLGRHSPVIETEQRGRCANVLWERCMNRFRQAVMQNESAFIAPLAHCPDAFEALKILFNHQSEPDAALLMLFPRVIAAFSPEIAEKYTDHLVQLFQSDA
ncbi:MAG: glycosyltransferase [Gloeobacteraceae cyanobacterium ES-bin-144]|nr:glycosyltransferase [Verrucomicrobiales bacterium]